MADRTKHYVTLHLMSGGFLNYTVEGGFDLQGFMLSAKAHGQFLISLTEGSLIGVPYDKLVAIIVTTNDQANVNIVKGPLN